MTVQFDRAVPIFRIFSLDKAREFYVDFLGFKIDWEYRFEPDTRVYMQVSRNGLLIHLSEHYGDGTPGSIAFVHTTGVRELQRELIDKGYRYLRPGVEEQEWGMTTVTVTDPFNNRITFGEPTRKEAGADASD